MKAGSGMHRRRLWLLSLAVLCTGPARGADIGAWGDVGYWSGWIKVKHELERREKTASFENVELGNRVGEALRLELAPADYSDDELVDWREDVAAATLSCQERTIEKDFSDLPKLVTETRSTGQGAGEAQGEIHLQVFPSRREYTIHYYFSGIDIAGVTEWYRDGVLTESNASSGPCDLSGWVTEPLPDRPGPIEGRQVKSDGAAQFIVEWQLTPAN